MLRRRALDKCDPRVPHALLFSALPRASGGSVRHLRFDNERLTIAEQSTHLPRQPETSFDHHHRFLLIAHHAVDDP